MALIADLASHHKPGKLETALVVVGHKLLPPGRDGGREDWRRQHGVRTSRRFRKTQTDAMLAKLFEQIRRQRHTTRSNHNLADTEERKLMSDFTLNFNL